MSYSNDTEMLQSGDMAAGWFCRVAAKLTYRTLLDVLWSELYFCKCRSYSRTYALCLVTGLHTCHATVRELRFGSHRSGRGYYFVSYTWTKTRTREHVHMTWINHSRFTPTRNPSSAGRDQATPSPPADVTLGVTTARPADRRPRALVKSARRFSTRRTAT